MMLKRYQTNKSVNFNTNKARKKYFICVIFILFYFWLHFIMEITEIHKLFKADKEKGSSKLLDHGIDIVKNLQKKKLTPEQAAHVFLFLLCSPFFPLTFI